MAKTPKGSAKAPKKVTAVLAPPKEEAISEDEENLVDEHHDEDESDEENPLPVVYNPYDSSALESAEKSLAASDPLKRYLQDIKNAPVLTPEQEAALVKRMHDSNDMNAAKF